MPNGHYLGCWEAAPLVPKPHLWKLLAAPPPRMERHCLGASLARTPRHLASSPWCRVSHSPTPAGQADDRGQARPGSGGVFGAGPGPKLLTADCFLQACDLARAAIGHLKGLFGSDIFVLQRAVPAAAGPSTLLIRDWAVWPPRPT